MSGSHLSKDFFDLVKSIGESKSKQEEDRIILTELVVLKRKMGQREKSAKRLKEFLVRLIYVEMLGHDASFGYMKAVEMAASTNLLHKRVGYLTAGLCLSPEHEFRMMLVNRLHKDMESSNMLIACAALMAACKLLTVDMIPAVLPQVTKLLTHDREIVRKKAVMVLHRFHQIDPSSVADLGAKFRQALCDRDPSVMGASLHVLHDLAKTDPSGYKDLVPSFVSILKQITEHRLPRDFDYHRIPAPWIQMQLLRLLAILGQADMQASEGMYEVLLDVMRRADTGISVGYAIIYECVRTVTTIYPNATLLDAAAAAIARFISSDNHNLKYLGVTGLAAIVKDHPKYAAEHQLAVIDCLEDPDETLKRKTLDLLFRMTNPVNVEVVTSKLLAFLRGSVDRYLRKDLVSRITQVAERFAPSNQWYLQTMTEVFELGGDLVQPEVANNLMRLIAEGVGEDEESDAELRRYVVDQYLTLLDKPNLPDILMQTVFWVLGEYAYMSPEVSLEAITEKLCAVANRATVDPTTRGYAVSAALKLTAQLGRLLPVAAGVVDRYVSSQDVDVAQRCKEFRELSRRPGTMTAVLPVDASMEDIDVDENLGFMDSFVQQQVANGARQYSPPTNDDDGDDPAEDGGGLRFEAYETPEEPNFQQPTHSNDAGGMGMGAGGAGAGGSAAAAQSGLNVSGVKAVWGDTGYAGGDTSAGAAGQPATPPLRHQAAAKRPWDYSAEEVEAAATAGPEEGGSNQEEEAAQQTSSGGTPGGNPSLSIRQAVTPKPRELTEREKMAAALFGGIAAAPAPAAAESPRRGMLGRVGSRGANSASAPAPAPAPAPPADDLLGLMGGLSVAPPTVPAQAPAPAPAPASALGDLFGPATPTPASGAGQSAGAGAGGAGLDLFGGLGGGASAGGAPDTASTIATMAFPAAVASAASGKKASDRHIVLGNDANLYLAGNKIWNGNNLTVVILLRSTGSATLNNVQVKVTVPPCFKIAGLAGEPSPRPVSADTLAVGNLAGASASACLAVSLALATTPSAGSLSLAVTYNGAASPQVTGNLPMAVHDCIRPSPMKTAEFGGMWGSHGAAISVTVPTKAITSPDAFLAAVAKVNINPVDKIAATSEAIAAGVLMGTTQTCLVHAKIAGGQVLLSVRTKDAGYSNLVAQMCRAAL